MAKNQLEPQIGVFTGGGTGGHVYPGLAVWEKIRTWWTGPLLWVGSTDGMEKTILGDLGLPYKGIPAGKLRRYYSFRNVTDLFRILAGFFIMILFFKRKKAAFVFSKGGFVSVPVVWAARLMGIPVFSHESDLVPGLATRLNLPMSVRLFLSDKTVAKHLSARYRSKALVTGNPVRSQIKNGSADRARMHWHVPDNKPLILVLGGSSGALQINKLIPGLVEALGGQAFVLHQCGQRWEIPRLPNYQGVPYIGHELADALARADLLISRAGAGSLWEAAYYRLPMVLIPLTAGSRGDQVVNARHWERLGCAVVLHDPNSRELSQTVTYLLDHPNELNKMKQAFQKIPTEDAAERISREMRALLLNLD